MRKPTTRCGLLAPLLSRHRWGSPIGRDELLRLSPIDPQEYPAAKEMFEELRDEPYITDCGNRGIKLNNSRFDALVEVLYHECEWEPYEIQSRVKHYEGFDDHDWA